MNELRPLLAATCLLVVSFTGLRAQTTINFNSSSDLSTYFNSSTGANFTNATTGGLGTSGAVTAPNDTSQAWVFKTGDTLSVGRTYTVSMFFRANGDGSGFGELGFVPSATIGSVGNYSPAQSLGIVFEVPRYFQ